MTATLELLLVGFGHVARRFVTLLDEQRGTLSRKYGLTIRIVGVATRHGRLILPTGLEPSAVTDRFTHFLATVPAHREMRTTPELIADVAKRRPATRDGRLVVVETTTLDIKEGQPAIDHVRAALSNGAHVVTVNKGPAAFAYHTLDKAAEKAGRRFLFEGAVMDGVPIFNLVRETLPAVTILGFRGVVNTTTNYIITEMELGEAFEEALRAMQVAGIAEADPSLDVDGWDAAAKTAALANVLLEGRITPQTVEREGIGASTAVRAREARTRKRRLKLVARAARVRGGVQAGVALEELDESDVLANLEGQQNALVLHTDLLGEIAIVQRGSGLTQTAYALLSDLLTIGTGVTGRTLDGRSRS